MLRQSLGGPGGDAYPPHGRDMHNDELRRIGMRALRGIPDLRAEVCGQTAAQDALLVAEDGPVNRQAKVSGVPETAGGILLEAPEPAPCQRRLLLAEDDADTRRLLGATLRRQGFEVVEACDGAELLEHLSAAV